jgi:hypothetical protein
VIFRMPALQADTFHLPRSRPGFDRFLLSHFAAAMAAFLPLAEVRFRNRNGFPSVHAFDPKMVCWKEPAGLQQAIEVVLGILPDLLTIACDMDRHRRP